MQDQRLLLIRFILGKKPNSNYDRYAKSLRTLNGRSFSKFDEKVLSAIKRTNISTERLINFVDEIKKYVNTIILICL